MEFKFFPIGDIANFINGYAFKPEDWSEDGLKIIRIQNLTDPTKPYNKTQKKIDEKYLVKYDDVLVSWSATIDVFIWKQEEAYLNQHIFKVEFDKNKIIKQYFIFALKDTLQQLCKNAHGSTMKHIVKKDFDNHKIILPGITEQIKIAKILSWVEELIEDRKNSIDLLDDLLKSKFHEMFGNPIRNENKWELKLLKDICSKITDGTHDTPERLKKGVKFITGKHIRPFVIDFENSDYVTQEVHNEIYNRCNPEYGDILYTNIGVNLGTAAMNTVHYEFSMKNVALLKLSSSISSRFIEHLLNHPIFKEKISQDFSSGGAQKFLSLNKIKQIKVIVPPIELQNQFAKIAEEVEFLKKDYKQSLTELENLYGSLSQRAFKGELDLSRLDITEELEKMKGDKSSIVKEEHSAYSPIKYANELQNIFDDIDKIQPRIESCINEIKDPIYLLVPQDPQVLNELNADIKNIVEKINKLPAETYQQNETIKNKIKTFFINIHQVTQVQEKSNNRLPNSPPSCS